MWLMVDAKGVSGRFEKISKILKLKLNSRIPKLKYSFTRLIVLWFGD